jgi:hypothetical protein
MVEAMVEAMEEVVRAILGDTLTATAVVTGDMDMGGEAILIGGVILIAGVILIGGVTLTDGVIRTGGTTLTIPTMIPTTILITMRAMEGRRFFQKGVLLWRNRENSNLLIGTSVRTQRVTTPTLKIARVVG